VPAPTTVAGYTLIDIREPREVHESPLAQTASRHIPLDILLGDATALDPEQKYLLICARGARSRAAAEHLRAHGVPHAYSLRGGLAALRERDS
jgi:rhodanese-related sulfurtransferase